MCVVCGVQTNYTGSPGMFTCDKGFELPVD